VIIAWFVQLVVRNVGLKQRYREKNEMFLPQPEIIRISYLCSSVFICGSYFPSHAKN